MNKYRVIQGRATRYIGHFLYIKLLDRIVYCHEATRSTLTIGSPGRWINSAKDSVVRQQMSIEEMMKYNPIIIDLNKLSSYSFLHKHNWKYREGWVWATHSSKDENEIDHVQFPGSTFVADAPISETKTNIQ